MNWMEKIELLINDNTKTEHYKKSGILEILGFRSSSRKISTPVANYLKDVPRDDQNPDVIRLSNLLEEVGKYMLNLADDRGTYDKAEKTLQGILKIKKPGVKPGRKKKGV
jgi:hypothetical protein